LFLSEGRPTVHIVDQYPDKALKVTANEQLSTNRWHHVMAVFDGRRKGADAVALYVDGLKAQVEVNNNSLGSNILTDVPLRLGGRSGPSGPDDSFVTARCRPAGVGRSDARTGLGQGCRA